MKVLLHVCCGPCSVAVMEWLLDQGHEVTALFFNPNIQPLAEYMRRREAAILAADHYGVPLLLADTFALADQLWGPYDRDEFAGLVKDVSADNRPADPMASLPPAIHPVLWLRLMQGRETARCPLCWSTRLEFTARTAAARGFEGITSSLLYSRYQDHAVLRRQGGELSARHGVEFVYHDFREFWQKGIEMSKELGLYRQPYCGCMFSEYERYAKKMGKTLAE